MEPFCLDEQAVPSSEGQGMSHIYQALANLFCKGTVGKQPPTLHEWVWLGSDKTTKTGGGQDLAHGPSFVGL